jgi:aspartate ammonia-lyase
MLSHRIEKDSIGEMEIPDTADYGIHTARAVANFPITGVLLNHYPELVQSLAMAKKAAALANLELGALNSKISGCVKVTLANDNRWVIQSERWTA